MKSEEPALPDGLVSLDREDELPLPQQLYRAIRAAVIAGNLRPGMRLPSSRRLASELGVSRNTVNAAFELLKGESIVGLNGRAAPVIAQRTAIDAADTPPAAAPAGARLSQRGRLRAEDGRGPAWARRPGALQPGAPALDLFPYELWARSLRRAALHERSPALHYGDIAGVPKLREVLSRYLAAERGVKADPAQIVVVASTQGALSALAEALTEPGDTAWIEDPGYLGARAALKGAGLKLAGLPVDGDGADVAAMAPDAPPPKLVYVTPSHQYPTGARLSLPRRVALIARARAAGAVILEDDYDSEFLFSGRPIAALQGLAEDGEVIYLGTFAKSLAPGLRVAYCVVPRDLAPDLAQLFRNTGRLASVQTQAALADFIDGGHYRAHLRRIREAYEARGMALYEALSARLGNRVDVAPPTGNVQLSLTFREADDDIAVATMMQGEGFAVSPLSACYLDRPPRPGLVVGFAGATPAQIEGGVSALARALDAVSVSRG